MPAYLAKAIASATWVFIALFACAAFGIALNIATVGKAADESEGTAIARSSDGHAERWPHCHFE